MTSGRLGMNSHQPSRCGLFTSAVTRRKVRPPGVGADVEEAWGNVASWLRL